MAYNAKEIWIPTDKQSATLNATQTSGATAVKSGGAAISRGICTGYHFKVSAVDANNTAIPVKLFDASSGDLIYSTTVAATATQGTETVDTLDTPLPFFETPYFTIGAIQSGAAAGITYTVRFFFKAMA